MKQKASYIDHSVLKPQFTLEETKEQIQKGVDYGCKTVCINPWAIDLAKDICQGTETGICVVCDFPFGQSSTDMRVQQAEAICQTGIDELDLVANYGLIRSGEWEQVKADVQAVADVCHKHDVLLKTIIESDALEMEDIMTCVEVIYEAGSDFIKTSTGFYTGGEVRGAYPELMGKMISAAAGRIKVKGSGCIRTQDHFDKLIDLGIDRMGVGYRSTPVVLGLTEGNPAQKQETY